MQGRIVGPMPSALREGEVWTWKNSHLVKFRRTLGEPKQMHSRNMITIETIGETVLPNCVASEKVSTTHGPQKYAQIGGDAAAQLITSMMASYLRV